MRILFHLVALLIAAVPVAALYQAFYSSPGSSDAGYLYWLVPVIVGPALLALGLIQYAFREHVQLPGWAHAAPWVLVVALLTAPRWVFDALAGATLLGNAAVLIALPASRAFSPRQDS